MKLFLSPLSFHLLMAVGFSSCPSPIKGSFSVFQLANDLCTRFEDSLFLNCNHQTSKTDSTVYGGALCLDNPDATFELSACTFFSCRTDSRVSTFRLTTFGGAAYLNVAEASVERCCARQCSSLRGQAFCLGGCPSPNFTDSTFVNCTESTDHTAEDGALSHASQQSGEMFLSLSNANFSGCFSNEGGSIVLSAGEGGCGSWHFLSVNGGIPQVGVFVSSSGTTTIDHSTFYDNECVFGAVYAEGGLISLEHCYFKNNGRDLGSSGGGKFIGVSSFFHSAVPAVAWESTSGVVGGFRGTVLVICHFASERCSRAPCPTSDFTPSHVLALTAALFQTSFLPTRVTWSVRSPQPVPRRPRAQVP
jgi:hypothetical protein